MVRYYVHMSCHHEFIPHTFFSMAELFSLSGNRFDTVHLFTLHKSASLDALYTIYTKGHYLPSDPDCSYFIRPLCLYHVSSVATAQIRPRLHRRGSRQYVLFFIELLRERETFHTTTLQRL